MLSVVIALLLVMPFIEIWFAIQVSAVIGGPLTLLFMALTSLAGVVLLKREGLAVWRRANAEMAAGRMPAAQLVDGALVLVGGIALVLPGFISAAFGALLMVPPVRTLLRPLLVSWMAARAARMAGSTRVDATFVHTVVGPDGRPRQRSGRTGDVIDSDGWDVDDAPPTLPRAGAHDDVIEGHTVDPRPQDGDR